MITLKNINSDLNLVRLEEKDYDIYSQMFKIAPYLSFNENNYKDHFRNPMVEIVAIVRDKDLVGLLGTEKGYDMEYSTADGKRIKKTCHYLFSGYVAPKKTWWENFGFN